MSDHCTVYYDKSCPLCAVEIGHYQSLNGSGAVQFIDASDPTSQLGPSLTRSDAMGRFHVRDRNGALVSGAEAFVVLWGQLPGWRHVARIARGLHLVPALEWLYRGFLPLRPYLSRFVRRLRNA